MIPAPENLMRGLRFAFDSIIPDEQDKLRSKYYEATLIALNRIYESLSTYPYDEFIKSQLPSNTIPSPVSPNGTLYEIDDIRSLELKDITDRNEQINILKELDKYKSERGEFYHEAPLWLELSGDTMTLLFEGEYYQFSMRTRLVKNKKIDRRYYDKILMDVSKGFIYVDSVPLRVASVSLYYRSPSDFRPRYVTLYDDEGNEILDYAHLTEYNKDQV